MSADIRVDHPSTITLGAVLLLARLHDWISADRLDLAGLSGQSADLERARQVYTALVDSAAPIES